MSIAIVGGSIAGLSAATVLLRLGINVIVFEKYSGSFANRGSSLGFVDIGLWEQLKGKQMLRRGRQAHRYQGAYYYGDLWNFWYSGLPEGTVKFGEEVIDLGDDPMKPTINGQVYDAVILADGGWSTLREKYITDKKPDYSGHIIYRCKVLKSDFPDFDSESAYMSPDQKYFSIALNVALDDGTDYIMGGVSIGAPEEEAVALKPTAAANRQVEWVHDPNSVPKWFLPFIRRTFGQHKQLVQWIEKAANGPGKITRQPLYEFGADRVTNGRIILIGDAAHMASPGTAAGAHTGVLDAAGLLQAFSTFQGIDNIDLAIKEYSKGGLKRARELYARSKQVSQSHRYIPGDELIYNPPIAKEIEHSEL
ncbi:hypothetical protein HDU79_004204 [Rhizoclosmatium sp. JEL0117]|nr:hypothetical protein HDU79_004204 [Rhizoclosmatium sp. JEL0117]